MQTTNNLTMEQKETVGLLSIGTCLEWFDVFLYIHMAVLLDQIFFSKNDQESWILSNIAICSAFVLKPIGGVMLGWLGDKIGRTSVIFISTLVTGMTCVIIAMMPTYAQIGIIASFAITGCKVIQAIVATGEFYNADIYIAEMAAQPKKRCAMSVLLCLGSWSGGKFLATALVAISLFCVDHGITQAWRAAFLCGGFVAVIGVYARRTLYETGNFTKARKLAKDISKEPKPEILKESFPKLSLFYHWIFTLGMALFSLAWQGTFLYGGFVTVIGINTKKILHEMSSFNQAKKLEKSIPTASKPDILKEPFPKLSLFYYSMLTLGNILFGLFPFTYCKDLLVNMGYSASKIALQSWFVGIFFTLNLIGYFFLVRFFCPLKIMKYRTYGTILLMLFLPYLIKHASSNVDILVLQFLVLLFGVSSLPASPIIYQLFPTLTRSRSVLIPNAFSGAFGFIFLNFSIPVLSHYFAQYTFAVLALPVAIISVFGVQHFQKAYQNSINNHDIEYG